MGFDVLGELAQASLAFVVGGGLHRIQIGRQGCFRIHIDEFVATQQHLHVGPDPIVRRGLVGDLLQEIAVFQHARDLHHTLEL